LSLTRRHFLRDGLVGAATVAASGPSLIRAEARRPRNVLFVCLDTVRADHLSTYGYVRRTSPNLDRLAERSVVFEDVLSPSSWTLPVLASVMTGLYPAEHGATYFRTPIREGTVRLAEVLGRAGMTSAAFGQFPFHFGFYRFPVGFDTFRQKWSMLAPTTTGQVLRWLRDRPDDGRGFFAWVHYFEPHLPYQIQLDSVGFYDWKYRGKVFDVYDPKAIIKLAMENTPQARADLLRVLDLYDGEIFCADKYLGWVLAELRRLKLMDDTMVIVMADHGEHFLEHGMVEHGNSLYEELVRVPLVIYAPGCRPGRCPDLVSLIDLMPTILEYLRVPGPKTPGRSLMPVLQGERPPDRALFSALDVVTSVIFVPDGRDPSDPNQILTKDNSVKNMKAVRHGKRKLIFDAMRQAYEYYDLAVDPREQLNLLATGYDPPADLKRELDDWIVAMNRYKPPVAAPDPAIIESMRALGYIQ
jgi:arylsulfatase A-like enzyme